MPFLRPLLVFSVLATMVLGLVYPMAITVAARWSWTWQATGSLLTREGHPLGSALIGQPWTSPAWFWGRPSATMPPANAMASGGSNLAQGDPALRQAVAQRVAALLAAGAPGPGPVPIALVTASASGLDPHLPPAAAHWQVPRIAAERQVDPAAVEHLITRCTEPPLLGILGEERVNVLVLNLALANLRVDGPDGR